MIAIACFDPKYLSATSIPFLYDNTLCSNRFKNSFSTPILGYAIARTAIRSAFGGALFEDDPNVYKYECDCDYEYRYKHLHIYD